MRRVFGRWFRAARHLRRDIRFLVWRSRNDFQIADTPFLDTQTLALLESELAKAASYVEFGAGASTVLAARTCRGKIVSVESDAKFLAAVQRRVDPEDLRRTTLIHANMGVVGAWGKPVLSMGRSYPQYPQAPWRRDPSLVPDLVFVDGRCRVACVLETMLRVPEDWGGLIIVDDYDGRDHYTVIEQFGTDINRHGRSISLRKGKVDRDRCRQLLQQYYSDYR